MYCLYSIVGILSAEAVCFMKGICVLQKQHKKMLVHRCYHYHDSPIVVPPHYRGLSAILVAFALLVDRIVFCHILISVYILSTRVDKKSNYNKVHQFGINI